MQEWKCDACGQWWHLPNRVNAAPGKFFRDDGGYGCPDDEYCHNGHAGFDITSLPEWQEFVKDAEWWSKTIPEALSEALDNYSNPHYCE